jgi:hypothetical protein
MFGCQTSETTTCYRFDEPSLIELPPSLSTTTPQKKARLVTKANFEDSRSSPEARGTAFLGEVLKTIEYESRRGGRVQRSFLLTSVCHFRVSSHHVSALSSRARCTRFALFCVLAQRPTASSAFSFHSHQTLNIECVPPRRPRPIRLPAFHLVFRGPENSCYNFCRNKHTENTLPTATATYLASLSPSSMKFSCRFSSSSSSLVSGPNCPSIAANCWAISRSWSHCCVAVNSTGSKLSISLSLRHCGQLMFSPALVLVRQLSQKICWHGRLVRDESPACGE